jgi:O-antigen ligase
MITELLSEAKLGKRGLFLLTLLAVSLAVSLVVLEDFLPGYLIKLGLIALVAAPFGLIIFAYPKIGAYAAVFYIWTSLATLFEFRVSYPIVVVAALGTLLQLLKGEGLRLRNRFFSWSMAIFTILAIQSMLFSHSIHYSIQSFSFYLKSLIVVFLIVQTVRSPKDLRYLAMMILTGALASVVIGVMTPSHGLEADPMLETTSAGRFAGLHGDPNLAAVYLISAIPIGAFAVKRGRSVPVKMLFGLATLTLVAATLFTFSRAAIFPLSFVIVSIYIREARSKVLYLMLIFIVVMAVLLTPAYYWRRLLTIPQLFAGNTADSSLYLRVKAAQVAWSFFLEHPITGIGLNNFLVRSTTELPWRKVVHNAYLEILVGVGVFGFIAYVMMHLAAFVQFVKALNARWSEENAWLKDLTFYLIISYISILIGALFLSIEFVYMMWILPAAGLVLGNLADRVGSSR